MFVLLRFSILPIAVLHAIVSLPNRRICPIFNYQCSADFTAFHILNEPCFPLFFKLSVNQIIGKQIILNAEAPEIISFATLKRV